MKSQENQGKCPVEIRELTPAEWLRPPRADSLVVSLTSTKGENNPPQQGSSYRVKGRQSTQ